MSLDWKKPIQTSKGEPLRVVGDVNCKGRNCKVVAKPDGLGNDSLYTFELDGSYSFVTGFGWTVVNVPNKLHREFWVNIYRENTIGCVTPGVGCDTHPTQEAAKLSSGSSKVLVGAIARVKVVIDCEEGEGL